jgi:nucleotide-binding universal stress UspA family protein
MKSKNSFSETKKSKTAVTASIIKDQDDLSKGKVIDLVPSLLDLRLILVPIDFSKTSRKALQYAIPFAQQFGAKILLLHILEPYMTFTADADFAPPIVDNRLVKNAALKRLEGVEKKYLPKEIRAGCKVRVGSPFREITECAKINKADLIILTTHGHTGLKHVFLGSTAERIVRHAPCPVLTVREKEHEFV